MDIQEELLAGVLQRVDADRRHHRARGKRRKTLPHFTIGDSVLVARVFGQGKHRKLMSPWTGPWPVANGDKKHVYAMQHLVTGELRDFHVVRMRFYTDDQLEITGELLKVFQQINNQGRVPHPERLGYRAGCNNRRIGRQGGLGRAEGGGEHLGADVARVS